VPATTARQEQAPGEAGHPQLPGGHLGDASPGCAPGAQHKGACHRQQRDAHHEMGHNGVGIELRVHDDLAEHGFAHDAAYQGR